MTIKKREAKKTTKSGDAGEASDLSGRLMKLSKIEQRLGKPSRISVEVKTVDGEIEEFVVYTPGHPDYSDSIDNALAAPLIADIGRFVHGKKREVEILMRKQLEEK